ncbi:probable amino acid permease 7 [Phtheirospermum japonicum]|uniref:Probable amino acid permease 7 n=1 Tax=Phtheirospermum japonicum TaxID=374723 RepID=A0A830CCM2_9LAMI|nr:probable amino acid permease 7 [Phtheirospermum japonicum]
MVMVGTKWTAVEQVITGVIGVGVLSLAWSTAQLGWVAGPLVIVIFAAITQVSTLLVCYCYKSLDPVHGPTRNTSFIEAVKFYLGRFVFLFSSVFSILIYCSLSMFVFLYFVTSIFRLKLMHINQDNH